MCGWCGGGSHPLQEMTDAVQGASRSLAGSQRYKVGADTSRWWATSRGGIPPASSARADSRLPLVIRRRRPPTRPRWRATP